MKAKAKDNSWTPIRDGETYCSTACGGKCTWTCKEFVGHGRARVMGDLITC